MIPVVSVVVPAYNAAPLIGRCLRSVLAQKGAPEFEILVVDDGSTDNTIEVVEAVGDARIKVFRQPKNRGPAAARNRGLAEARGEYLAFLDADDFWEPDFLRETSEFLDSRPEAVAVSVRQCHKIIGKPPAISPRDTGIAEPVLLEDFFAFWAKYNHVCTGSVLMKTEIARRVGGQREDLRICEDLEFWAMLATCGPWGLIPDVLFTSDGGAVTRKQGWLAKNRKRWASAVPVAEWERRLKDRIPADAQPGYRTARGRIARNLCYSMILAGKKAAARREVSVYGAEFPSGRASRCFRRAARCGICWSLFCAALRIREFLR